MLCGRTKNTTNRGTFTHKVELSWLARILNELILGFNHLFCNINEYVNIEGFHINNNYLQYL